MVATAGRPIICHSRDLTERGRGVRFTVRWRGQSAPAFVIRFEGRVYAYLNRCAHRRLELDWNAGDFFDALGTHLLCATHGARYDPASGTCVAGPCYGAALIRLGVTEKNGEVLLDTADDIHLIGLMNAACNTLRRDP